MTAPLTRTPGLAEVAHEDYTVVLNLPLIEQQQVPYRFDGVSFEIWTRIDGSRTEAQIVDELAEQYDAPRDQIATDVHAFLEQLLELRLIEDAGDADMSDGDISGIAGH